MRVRLHSIVLCIGLLAFVRTASSEDMPIGKPAPWFALPRIPQDSGVLNLTKVEKRLGNDAGRHAAFVFFAEWCAPCMAGLRDLSAHREEFLASGVPLILVDASLSDDQEKVRSLVQSLALDVFPLVQDRFGQQSRGWGIAQGEGMEGMELPATVILDGKGVVRAVIHSECSDYVARLLKGR